MHTPSAFMASSKPSLPLSLSRSNRLHGLVPPVPFPLGNGKEQAVMKVWKGLRCSCCKCNKQWQQHALSKIRTQGYRMQFISGVAATRSLLDTLPTDEETEALPKLSGGTTLPEMVQKIKDMLKSINDGEITVSAYDTAWVALIKDVNGGEGPQFPSTIEWIVSNQLTDGSWGDAAFFSAHDRMINTLACVIVLTSWRVHPESCNRGLVFLRENMCRLAEEAPELMPIGFEIAFPSLMQMAKDLGLEVPFDDPILQNINAMRDIKLKRIPKDVMHEVPTTLLHSLEGMPNLNWERLLKLQCDDGSFLFSPSATAYAAIQTNDEKCLGYLQQIVNRFHGGAPNVHPVDLFERIWVVDRLERLGISRYFKTEIVSLLDYVHKSWSDQGICWARNSRVHDIDDTSMAFRLLRLHGYEVSPCVFKHFVKDGEFICFAGQSNQAVTGIYNLNRASQIMFPDEHILQQAMNFSCKFLRQKQALGQLRDKWFITKDLPGEVAYALDFPWYASLPRVEARLYLDQYGGSSDVWIGKTLYRMPLVSNDFYLELAKEDFNHCQMVHQLELHNLLSWYKETELERFNVKRKDVQRAHFLAASSIFEPERAPERLAWAQTSILADAITSFFTDDGRCSGKLHEFILNFLGKKSSNISSPECFIKIGEQNKRKDGLKLVSALNQTLELMSSESASLLQNQGQQEYTYHYLRHAWMKWLLAWKGDEADYRLSYTGQMGLLLVNSIEICAGRFGWDDLRFVSENYTKISQLTASICYWLHQITLHSKDLTRQQGDQIRVDKEVEREMQELAQLLIESPNFHECNTKGTILSVVRSFYYLAHCSPLTIDKHVSMVIFDKAE
ncbi:ent-copalyl diphosphate synthase 1 [Carex littledalei]|uniref:Ent-copalyl diphosphate synthase 1 n=1 Tax=Carex littledalei TaxID=544730 RepID=A0A833QJV7_9POAL|nr:ent-copalyl diphosphate synthase 1 [Carex littledalei]